DQAIHFACRAAHPESPWRNEDHVCRWWISDCTIESLASCRHRFIRPEERACRQLQELQTAPCAWVISLTEVGGVLDGVHSANRAGDAQAGMKIQRQPGGGLR